MSFRGPGRTTGWSSCPFVPLALCQCVTSSPDVGDLTDQTSASGTTPQPLRNVVEPGDKLRVDWCLGPTYVVRGPRKKIPAGYCKSATQDGPCALAPARVPPTRLYSTYICTEYVSLLLCSLIIVMPPWSGLVEVFRARAPHPGFIYAHLLHAEGQSSYDKVHLNTPSIC